MKEYKKLVRDNIPEIMINNGASPVIKVLNDKEYLDELNKKLLEEVKEYLESGELEELCDIEEVLPAILKFNNVSKENFEEKRLEKVKKRGAFDKKIFLIKEL